MRRFFVLATLAALLPIGACGGGASDRFLANLDPIEQLYALPVFNDGSTKTLGLKNFCNRDATVYVWLYDGFSSCGTGLPAVVPANGERRLPLGSPTSGWIHVETRDPLTLDPVTGLPTPTATTGFVLPYLTAERFGIDAESIPACQFTTGETVFRTTPRTETAIGFNRTYLPFAGGAICEPAIFRVRYFDTAGVLLDSSDISSPQTSPFPIPLGPLAGGVVGQISIAPAFPQIAPAGTIFSFAVATMEDQDLAYQNALPLLMPTDVNQAEMPLEWGRDSAGGIHDFAIAVTNGADAPRNVTLSGMHGLDGGSLKGAPRVFTLPARATRYFATTLIDSVGLVTGEVHPFADLFGDASAATSLEEFHLSLSIPGDVALSARVFEPGAFSFNYTVRPISITHNAMVSDVVTRSTTTTGDHNTILLMNPNAVDMQVFIRAFTSGEGTQYNLPPVTLPSLGMLKWSPDGINVSEQPSAPPPALARVPVLSFLFSSNQSFGIGGKFERRNASNLLVSATPHIIHVDF